MTKIEKFCDAIKSHEGFFTGSRSQRNNNPGNFRCSSLMTELGAIRCDDNFSVFPDYETGWNALVQFVTYACKNELRSYKDKTIYGFFETYAPSGDNNTPRRYAEIVAKFVGVDPNSKMSELLTENTMQYFSQVDPRWKNVKLGTCADTIGQSGCKITCLGMFSGKTPEEVNKIIPYVNGCLTDDATAAKALGLEFQGRVKVAPVGFGWCIAETDHYAKKNVPQHFFIYDTNTKNRVDPLDLNPVPEVNNYNIVSYRLFKPLIKDEDKETIMDKDFVKAVSDLCGEDFGANLNEAEQKEAAKVLNAVKVHTQTLEEANGLLTEKVNEYGSKLEYLTNQNALCQANTVVLQEELVKAKELATGGIIEMTFLDLLRELKNRIIRF